MEAGYATVAIRIAGQPPGDPLVPRRAVQGIAKRLPTDVQSSVFLLDGHLGRLAASLRMLGFDCLYENDSDDQKLAALAQAEVRILLTRDRRLLMRKVVTYGYCLRSLGPVEQLSEVIDRFDLDSRITPFHRCLRCNHPLEPVSKEAILDRLEPLTRQYFDEFQICPACGQIYGTGSHYERMVRLVEENVGRERLPDK